MNRSERSSFLAVASASALFAATTPYDLIRPTWPLTWDEKVFEKFDTSVNERENPALPENKTPASYKAGQLMPDTLDQAYLDAINYRISPIRVNQAGYLESDKDRLFYFIGSASTFEVVDVDGNSLSTKVTGELTATGSQISSSREIVAAHDARTARQIKYSLSIKGQSGNVMEGHIPESVPTNTRLRIKVGNDVSSTFIVSEDVYTMVKDAALKFFGIQRDGNSQSWFHGPSHTKDGSGKFVNGKDEVTGLTAKAGDLQGGWLDMGDHLRESQTQAFAFMALAVSSAANPAKDVDHYSFNHAEFVKTDDIPDVLREAKHGADFFIRAYNTAQGVIDNMAVSVGNFGADHGYWGRPEAQDALPATGASRGGPNDRDLRLGELGSNISSEIVTGLAILSKHYAKYDKDFADSCLVVAEKMYEFAKNLKLKEKDLGPGTYDDGKKYVYNTKADGWSSAAYNGNNDSHDDLALAAIALHYATYETTGKLDYLNDAVEDKTIGVEQESSTGFFNGGWMAWSRDGMRKSSKNTSWANSHTYALYAFYKLLLKDTETADKYGISEEKRQSYVKKIAMTMSGNLSYLSTAGSNSIELPYYFGTTNFTTDNLWFFVITDVSWDINHYQIGNIFDVLTYAEVTSGLGEEWKSKEMKALAINQLNYILGVNPWDISFIYGVGDRNDNHPHHRASNPEGHNTNLLHNYKYVAPVGGLMGGLAPEENNLWDSKQPSWENYHLSEVGISSSALLVSVLSIMSNGGDDYYEKKCEGCVAQDPTPKATPSIGAYHQVVMDTKTNRIDIFNPTLNALDSVVAYVYVDAKEEDINSCAVTFEYAGLGVRDAVGYSRPAKDSTVVAPVKVEDSFNKETETYTWALPAYLDTIKAGDIVSLELIASEGVKTSDGCEIVANAKPATVDFANSWSFADHALPVGFKGVPKYESLDDAPENPYMVLRSKGKWIWGYGPFDTTPDKSKVHAVIASGKLTYNGRSLAAYVPFQGEKTLKVFDLLGSQLYSETFMGSNTSLDMVKSFGLKSVIVRLFHKNKVIATKALQIR